MGLKSAWAAFCSWGKKTKPTEFKTRAVPLLYPNSSHSDRRTWKQCDRSQFKLTPTNLKWGFSAAKHATMLPWIDLYFFILRDYHCIISPLSSNFQHSLPLSLSSNDLDFSFTGKTEAVRKERLHLPIDNKSTSLLEFVLMYFPSCKVDQPPVCLIRQPLFICTGFHFSLTTQGLCSFSDSPPFPSFASLIFASILNQHTKILWVLILINTHINENLLWSRAPPSLSLHLSTNFYSKNPCKNCSPSYLHFFLFIPCQSDFHHHHQHSTPLKIHNDLHVLESCGQPSNFILFDFSSIFGRIDDSFLLKAASARGVQ